MSSVYTGDPSTITSPLSRTVTAASNATPIVITTSVSHLFATGDSVTVSEVGGNTDANGTWTITVLSANTFELDGSVGSGAYAGPGGVALSNSLTPQFTIPDDGDTLDAASVNVALEMLADRTQFLHTNRLIAEIVTFTSSDTWDSGDRAAFAELIGWGGGGGGAGGWSDPATADDTYFCGGGGGGGAQMGRALVTLTPSTGYTVTIGAAGAGGTGSTGSASTNGTSGGDTIFEITAGAELARFRGAGRGLRGGIAASSSTNSTAPGGAPVKTGDTEAGSDNYSLTAVHLPRSPGEGGTSPAPGSSSNPLARGMSSVQGYVGGAPGAVGSNNVSKRGGSGGGGGGAGPGGNGAAGGAGGNGSAGTGTAGSAGSAAAANTGAGGGGGGGTGVGAAGVSAGGAGGAGGSGKLVLIVYRQT